MAKSARSSRTKANKAASKETVHGLVEDARLQRLSEKLFEIAKLAGGSLNGLEVYKDKNAHGSSEGSMKSVESMTSARRRTNTLSVLRKLRQKRGIKHSIIFNTMQKGSQVKQQKT